jgi:hypothetical protein
VTHTDCLKNLGIFLDSDFHFHNHVNCLFSWCFKLLGLVRSVTLSISSFECTLCMLYFTLFKSKLEYASIVWNSITSTDANGLKRTQQKFASLYFNHVFLYIHYGYAYALEELKLHVSQKKRCHLVALFRIEVFFGSPVLLS